MSRILPLLLFVALLYMVPSAAAAVTGIRISPTNPQTGQTLAITIEASPNESLPISLGFVTTIPAQGGAFNLHLKHILIPQKPNSISATVYPVKSLYLGTQLGSLPISLGTNAYDGVASISTESYSRYLPEGVPPGYYDIELWGETNPNVSQVTIKVFAKATVKTDSTGVYVLNYPTSSIPPGTVTATIGAASKTVVLAPSSGFINHPPELKLTKPDKGIVGEEIWLDATWSTDPDGGTLEFLWGFGDGTSSHGAMVSHVYRKEGVFRITVKASDAQGASDEDTWVVTIMDRSILPKGIIKAPTVVVSGTPVIFDASSSTSTGGAILSQVWTFDDGERAKGPRVTHVFSSHGVYTVTLTLTNEMGGSSTTTWSITVLPGNKPPIPRISMLGETLSARLITFDGSLSSDPDGEIVSYEWNFGDGATSTDRVAQHTYFASGEYKISLKVTDDNGGEAAVNTVLQIESSNRPPYAQPEGDTWGNPGETLEFDGGGSEDPDGRIIDFEWVFGDGFMVKGEHATHVYNKPGEFAAALTVTDDTGVKDTSQFTVKIVKSKLTGFFEATIAPTKEGFTFLGYQRGIPLKAVVTSKTQVSASVLEYYGNPEPQAELPTRHLPRFLDLEFSDPVAVVWPVYVEIQYNDADVAELIEPHLTLYVYTDGEWRIAGLTGVKLEENTVWASIQRDELVGSPLLIAPRSTSPNITAESIAIEPSSPRVGEEIAVYLLLANQGLSAGSVTIPLRVNGVTCLEETVTVDALASKRIKFAVNLEEVGGTHLEAAGLFLTVDVKAAPQPKITASILSLEPTETEPGKPIMIKLTLRNTGDATGTTAVEVKLDGLPVSSGYVNVLPSEEVAYSAAITVSSPGEHTVEAFNLRGVFTVTQPASPYLAAVLLVVAASALAGFFIWRRKRRTIT